MVRLIDRPDMTLDVYRGRKTTTQQQRQLHVRGFFLFHRPKVSPKCDKPSKWHMCHAKT